MKAIQRASIAATAAAILLAVTGTGAAADERLQPYEASYEVEYKGSRVGESIHSLEYDPERGVYVFESLTRARGLARLLRPRPVTEQSVLELHDEAPRPLEFGLDDGTRRGRDNVSIEFNWSTGEARVVTSDGPSVLPISNGVHDRATLQLALMLELGDGQSPGPHELIDDESVKAYRYVVDGEETVDTPSGVHATVKVTQDREGSSRRTIIWAAPELGYLPVKIEQRRDGETLTTLTLESFTGL